jgi:hypothetical protein
MIGHPAGVTRDGVYRPPVTSRHAWLPGMTGVMAVTFVTLRHVTSRLAGGLS